MTMQSRQQIFAMGSDLMVSQKDNVMTDKIAKKLDCGIIMPIGTFGNYTCDFWANIRKFIEEAITLADMNPLAAWEDNKNDVIHAKIIENISNLPVMVGLIVGSNPNVMLECGMRLWTNKPILLIAGIDEKIPFDVCNIPCLKIDTQCGYFSLSKLKLVIAEKLKYLVSDQYRTFKSYYSIPAEIETPLPRQKDDFDKFVFEVRDSFRRITEQQMQQLREIERLKFNTFNSGIAPVDFAGCLTGSVGPTGSSPLSCECSIETEKECAK